MGRKRRRSFTKHRIFKQSKTIQQVPNKYDSDEEELLCAPVGHKQPEHHLHKPNLQSSFTLSSSNKISQRSKCLLFSDGFAPPLSQSQVDQAASVVSKPSSSAMQDSCVTNASSLTGAIAKTCQSLLPPTTRRKLLDEVMAGFMIGNTFARSLLTNDEASRLCKTQSKGVNNALRFLWIGVGDIRNPLATLYQIPPCTHQIELHMNDQSCVVLARNIVLFCVAGSDISDMNRKHIFYILFYKLYDIVLYKHC